MSKSAMNPKVDFYFNKAGKWQEELEKLRGIILDCRLTEELKWGVPCYTFQKSNIVLLHVFKEYCAILFIKGALLKDAKGILIQQTENVQAARQIRFTGVQEINKLKATLKAYIQEAIEVEKAGLKVDFKETAEFKMPEEFENKLSSKAGQALKKAFKALTPGRQRAYLLYFSAPKQSKTRESRIEKCVPRILEGKGLND
ncbi:MAG: YdeI/OmpD-associated family protein [Bacteroidia bacterium]